MFTYTDPAVRRLYCVSARPFVTHSNRIYRQILVFAKKTIKFHMIVAKFIDWMLRVEQINSENKLHSVDSSENFY